ncbi:MAG: hypothetical protein K2N95_12260 [Lachnospiraceae bacterium]|nr:hypothetical protein [Lachnospiraceae bacterium]
MQMNTINMANGFHNLNRSANIDMRAGNNNSISLLRANAAKTNAGSVFGAQCKVTISREGRKLSEQMKAAEPRSFTAANAERLLIRQQKQDESNRREQSDTLSEISNLMSEIKNSYGAGEDRETIANKQEALNRLLDLKARQEEENKQRVKDAANSAAGASREQEEIDRKNADLYLMLKTFEEKDEEEHAEGSGSESDTADTEDGQGSIGDQFQESASMLGVSAAKRELEAKGVIEGMFDSGYGRLAQADAMMHEIQAELSLAAEALGKANLSEDEKNQLMSEHIGRAGNMMMSNYGEITDLRRKGHQEIQDAKELESRHIAVNPLDGVDRAKQTILDTGAAAALREASQDILDKTSEELEKRVQEEIDRRNEVVSGPGEDEEEKAEEIAEEKEAEQLEEKRQEDLKKVPN